MQDGSSLGSRWAAYHPTKGLLFWAAAAGAIATIVVGFAWGGWVTGGSAKRMAEAAAAARATRSWRRSASTASRPAATPRRSWRR